MIGTSPRPRQAIEAGKHVLIEKPSVLSLAELDELRRLAKADKGVLAKVVYHKLLDPDHKKLRTLVADGVLAARQQRLLLAAGAQVDFGQPVRRVDHRPQSRHLRRRPLHQADRLHLRRATQERQCTGQRGLVGPADGPTWDSTQLR
jgi:D-galacturonate reductase